MSSGIQIQVGHHVEIRRDLGGYKTEGKTGFVTRIVVSLTSAHVCLSEWPHWTILVPLSDLTVIAR